MGQTFQREMAKQTEAASEYKLLVGQEAKKEWRNKWLVQKLNAAIKKSIKKAKFTVTDEKVGSYLPFRRVWEAEGLDADGYRALGRRKMSKERGRRGVRRRRDK